MENKLKVEYIKLKDLKPYEKNAKTHTKENIEAIKKSIEKYGFDDPIGVWGDKNTIVEGHGRYIACKELGIKEVPCIRLDHLTDEELADLDLSDFDLDWGIEEPMEEKEVEEDDFDVEANIPEKPKAKLGDIYQLGNHRLMCGDSTSADDVYKLMNRQIADMVMTNPPYNVAIKNSQGMEIENDNLDNEDFKEFLCKAFENLESALKEGGAFYIWYASRNHIPFETALNKAGLTVREQLIWNKSSFVFGRQDYHWKHEPCLYGWKEGASHYFIDDRTQSTVIEGENIDLKKLKKDEMLRLLEYIFSDKVCKTVIDEDKVVVNSLHPTMKPIRLLARLIKNSCKQKELVLDLFGGSGSTLMACEQLDRVCYMMELDPKYVDVIIARWEQFTGKKAVKLN